MAVSPISGVVSQLLVASGSYVTTGTPIAVVTSSARLTLKASVPQRYFNEFALIKTANFKLPYSDKIFALDEMQGHRLTAGTMVLATNGYLTLNSVLWAMEALLLAAMQMSICWQSRIGCNLRADKVGN